MGREPDDALSSYVGGAPRSGLADRLVTPWWYHPALGGAVSLLIASFATGRGALVVAAAGLYLLSLYVLPRAYRRHTGVWVGGRTPPRAHRVAVRLGWTTTLGLLAGLLSAATPLWPLTLAVAVVVLVATQVLGRRFDDALREELRADPEIGFKIEESDEDGRRAR